MNEQANKELQDIYDQLMDEIEIVKKLHSLSGRPNKQINENDIAKAIIKSCDVIHIDLSARQNQKDYTFGIYDPISMGYIRDTQFITQLVHYIIDHIDPSPNLSISAIVRAVSVYLMAKSEKIRFANKPPSYIVKFKNKIINLKTKELYDFNDEEINQYDFIETLPYNILKPNERDKNMEEIVHTMLNTWSDNDEGQRQTIMQLFYAYLDKNGRNVQIILQSEGGDGKSTALRILSNMGNEESTLYANINQYNDDNIMNKLQPSTRLIAGDDMPSNYKMNNLGLSRFKTLIDGGFLNVSEKYMPNKLVSAQCLKIQATNTDLKFYENNDAVLDRILYIEWPHHNFRQNPVSEFNLDQLSGKYGQPNTKFMEALISIIAFDVEHFKKFNVTKKMREKTESTINENDSILMHIMTLKDEGFLDYEILPINIIYEHYKQWLNDTNPGSHPVKLQEYSKRIKRHLINHFNYQEGPMKTIRAIKKDEFDLDLVKDYYQDENKRSRTLINNNISINENNLDALLEEIKTGKKSEITQQDLIKLIKLLKDYYPQLIIDLSFESNLKIHELKDLPPYEVLKYIQNLLN